MTAENGRGEHGMQNPGDLRVPEGVVIEPAKRTLIVSNGAVLMDHNNFDSVVRLGGSEPTAKDENDALEETTFPVPVKRGT